jgi:hypothetical protein
MYPHFLGIGAQKAGTTWLHSMLARHNQIWVPHLKELHYFDRKYPLVGMEIQSGVNPRLRAIKQRLIHRLRRLDFAKLRDRLKIRRWRDIAWEIRYLSGGWDDTWYESLFDDGIGRVAGEITPAYSCLSLEGIANVKKLMPSVKLVLLLRDPVERAWSHARMDLLYRTGRTFQEVPAEEFRAHFDSAQSRIRGDYLGAIERWLSYFPSSQMFLGYYDEIIDHPLDLFTRILKFLGVEADDVPNTFGGPVNIGVEAKLAPEMRTHLALIYIEQVRELALRYGPYPSRWLRYCEDAISGHD